MRATARAASGESLQRPFIVQGGATRTIIDLKEQGVPPDLGGSGSFVPKDRCASLLSNREIIQARCPTIRPSPSRRGAADNGAREPLHRPGPECCFFASSCRCHGALARHVRASTAQPLRRSRSHFSPGASVQLSLSHHSDAAARSCAVTDKTPLRYHYVPPGPSRCRNRNAAAKPPP